MAQEVTKSQLAALISDEVKGVLKAEGLNNVLDGINERIEKAVGGLRSESSDFQAKLFGAIAPQQKSETDSNKTTGSPTGRIVRAIALSRKDGSGFDGVVKNLVGWGNKDLADAMVDSRQKAMAASIGPDGGYLVPEEFSTDVMEARRARTVVRASGPRIYPMPTGTFHLPKVASGVTGGYIGENANAVHSNPTLSENVLTWKKLAVTTAISNDLIRYGSPAADAVVRDDIVRSLAVSEDAAFLRGDGTGGSPKGLRYWASPQNIFAGQAASLANSATDMGKLLLGLMNANVPAGNWGWLFAPRTYMYLNTVQTTTGAFAYREEMSTGKFYGYPFKMTSAIPINLTVGANSDCSEIYLVNFDDMALGDSMRLTIDVSTEAAYHNGSSVVASFSLDQFVVRAIAEHDFVARDPNAIAILTGIRWGA
jgi:HK97 family phage major capsid protein